jgi:hypothetical protein
MFSKPTVLILGAGASAPYGFPLGRGLRDRVCRLPNTAEAGAIADLGYGPEELREFVQTLRYSGCTSVDWFLEDHPEFTGVGKAAIAVALIPFENPDRLFPPGAPTSHWYELLLNTLYSSDGAFDGSLLSIVTFNYDRSLEHYLFRVLETRSGAADRAAEALARLEIVHVHGRLGGLYPLVSDGRPYLPRISSDEIRTAADQIIVVGEASGETVEFERARALLFEAERIIFLGFGFHPESIRRLGVFDEPWDDERRERVRVRGTNFEVPPPVWKRIRSEVLKGAAPNWKSTAWGVHDYLTREDPLDS